MITTPNKIPLPIIQPQRPSRQCVSLEEMAHDLAVRCGLAIPSSLTGPTGRCRVCSQQRGAPFITQWGVCFEEKCQRQIDKTHGGRLALKRPGDCRIDPCKPMQCIHCNKEWGCRRGCDIARGKDREGIEFLEPNFHTPDDACIRFAGTPATRLDEEEDENNICCGPECFSQCLICREVICPEIMQISACGAELQSLINQGGFGRPMSVPDDVFWKPPTDKYTGMMEEYYVCPVCEWRKWYSRGMHPSSGPTPLSIVGAPWWGCTCRQHDTGNHMDDVELCYDELLEKTECALRSKRHPQYSFVRDHAVAFLRQVKDDLENSPHRRPATIANRPRSAW